MAAYLSGNKHFLYKRVIPKYTFLLTLTYASFPFSQLRNQPHHHQPTLENGDSLMMCASAMHMKIDATVWLPATCIHCTSFSPFGQVGMFLTQVLMDIVN